MLKHNESLTFIMLYLYFAHFFMQEKTVKLFLALDMCVNQRIYCTPLS